MISDSVSLNDVEYKELMIANRKPRINTFSLVKV